MEILIFALIATVVCFLISAFFEFLSDKLHEARHYLLSSIFSFLYLVFLFVFAILFTAFVIIFDFLLIA